MCNAGLCKEDQCKLGIRGERFVEQGIDFHQVCVKCVFLLAQMSVFEGG